MGLYTCVFDGRHGGLRFDFFFTFFVLGGLVGFGFEVWVLVVVLLFFACFGFGLGLYVV